MIEVKTLAILNSIQKNNKENEIAFCEETQKYYTWKNKWQEVKLKNDGVKMNLYDLNKSIIGQLKPLTKEQIYQKGQIIENMHNANQNIHYMLLCKEYNYYTIFEANTDPIITFKSAVCDIINELGDVYSIEYKDEAAIELWIKPLGEEEPLVFYLFPYDQGVVYYG